MRFSDACKAAEHLGFTAKRQKGSHNVFARPGEIIQLNFQERDGGVVKPYQARQLGQMIDKYWDAEKDELK